MARLVLNGLEVRGDVVLITDAGILKFGASGDVTLFRSAANTLKTEDSFVVGAADEFKVDVVNKKFYADYSGSSGTAGERFGIYAHSGDTGDTFVVHSAGGDVKVKANGLLDASPAGLRTKHESAATPTGGNSGEVRVGTDKVWFQDAGTWKSVAPAGASSTSFATLAKFGTD